MAAGRPRRQGQIMLLESGLVGWPSSSPLAPVSTHTTAGLPCGAHQGKSKEGTESAVDVTLAINTVGTNLPLTRLGLVG
uniref:Uncharacterized protein n=1 Tax=Leishmania guyanensis TaxID=5670 RepID=A0A1E1J1C5_LEIGU|nr:Hypothetical protein BN36_2640410 [Leishmania guyanensis]